MSGTSPNGDAVPITNKVQCLDTSGSSSGVCDPTGAWVNVAASLSFGQVVGLLTPNTNYVCYAAATYEYNGTTQYACSAPSAWTRTVGAPGYALALPWTGELVTVSGPDLTSNSDFGYAVRCVPAGVSCTGFGTQWYEVFSLALGADVQVGFIGEYVQCFTALYFYQGGIPQFRCSPPSSVVYVTP